LQPKVTRFCTRTVPRSMQIKLALRQHLLRDGSPRETSDKPHKARWPWMKNGGRFPVNESSGLESAFLLPRVWNLHEDSFLNQFRFSGCGRRTRSFAAQQNPHFGSRDDLSSARNPLFLALGIPSENKPPFDQVGQPAQRCGDACNSGSVGVVAMGYLRATYTPSLGRRGIANLTPERFAVFFSLDKLHPPLWHSCTHLTPTGVAQPPP